MIRLSALECLHGKRGLELTLIVCDIFTVGASIFREVLTVPIVVRR